MTNAPRPVTSTDVARVAGVSRSTVSIVLNGTPGFRIPPATRERVHAAAAGLGYVANQAAADLRRGASRTVLGVFDPGRIDGVAMQYLPVFTKAMHDAGLTLVVTVGSSEITEREAHDWAALRPMAAILFGGHLSAQARRIIGATGCVVIGEHDADVRMAIDQAAVATAGAAGLQQRGRRRLLQVLPAEQTLDELTATREPAFTEATGSNGLGTIRMALHADAAHALVAGFQSWPVRPDGILAHNDEYAALLVAALLDAGLAVPGDIAVLGSDNAHWGQWMRPALSTLIIEPGGMVERLVETLDAIRHGRPYPDTIPIDLHIRVEHRQTT